MSNKKSIDLKQLPKQWTLTEDQAAEVIRQYMIKEYNLTGANVNFRVGNRTEGYGMGEHNVTYLQEVKVIEVGAE